MIIVCSGCSFTHGMELWEEIHIPYYSQAKTHDEGTKISEEFFNNSVGGRGAHSNIDEKSRNLSYSGTLKEILGCEVINVGMGGASQQEIAQLTLATLSALKKKHPIEKIICIMQDTSPDRIWIKDRDPNRIYNRPINGLKSYVLPLLEKSYYDELEAYEIKDIYLKYSKVAQIHFDYYMQSAMVQNYCCNNDIDFMHFIMWDNQHRIGESNLDMTFMHDVFFDDKYCMPIAMVYKLEDYYGNKNFYLPGLHVNCDSHKVMGKWLVEEMQKRKIL